MSEYRILSTGQDVSYQCYGTFQIHGPYMPFLFFSVPEMTEVHLSPS